jgi:hypothetical protein
MHEEKRDAAHEAARKGFRPSHCRTPEEVTVERQSPLFLSVTS